MLKRGGAGAALFIDGHEQTSAPAEVIDPVCTVGGRGRDRRFLDRRRGCAVDWEHALRLAMRVAGRTVQQPYCSSGFPTLTDIGLSALDPDQLDEVSA